MKKIGVYDSGMGGLSLLARLIKDFPSYDYIYYGDSANAPYGVRTRDDIKNLSKKVVDKLIDQGAEAIIIACNTASSAAEEMLKREYDLPIFGIEPALDIAIRAGGKGSLLVLATNFTLSSPRFLDSAALYKKQRNIIPLAGPELVLLVERGITSGPEISRELSLLTKDIELDKVDAVVLGCTHFLFLEREIARFFGSGVTFFDSHRATVESVKSILGEGQGQGNFKLISSAGEKMEEKYHWMLMNYMKELT